MPSDTPGLTVRLGFSAPRWPFFHHRDGNPANNRIGNLELRTMTIQEERDRAVLARIGGHWYAQCITSPLDPGGPLLPLHDECVQAYGVDFAFARRDRLAAPPTLPESAFDWPVYRAALGITGHPWGYGVPESEARLLDGNR